MQKVVGSSPISRSEKPCVRRAFRVPQTIVKAHQSSVGKHVRSILMKLPLPETGDDHRRVLAVVTYLEAR
jgi:hypothetical protein